MNAQTVARAEWTRLWALRSTRWTLLAFVVVTVGFGSLISWGNAAQAAHAGDTLDGPATVALSGFFLSQVAMALLGVLSISSDYGNGAIRTTFAAVPRRRLLIVARAGAVTVVGLVVGWVASIVTVVVAATIDNGYAVGGPAFTTTDVRAVVGGGLYAAACTLFGFGLGLLLRNSAIGVTAAVGGLLVAPIIVQLIPGHVAGQIAGYVTSVAGFQILVTDRADHVLGPWAGFGVFCVWCAVFLSAGLYLLERRDA